LRRDELEAGDWNDSAGKLDCARADDLERACGNEIWDSVSGLCAGVVWCTRRECSGGFASARACGWFGIQAWIGGQAIYSMLVVLWPSAANHAGVSWACFFAFWLLNMLVIWRGIETIKFLEGIGAPFMLVWGFCFCGGLRARREAWGRF